MSATADPFNWPFPQRKDTMALSTIKPHEFGDRTHAKGDNIGRNLRVDDISGAQPCLKAYQYINKEGYINRKDDIAGATSKQLAKPNNREDYQLVNKDIKGTQPQINKFITTRNPSNPLEPVYNIPKAEPLEPIVPRFIRDNINIDDIEGTKPLPHFCKLRKNVVQFDEIEGSKPKARFQPRDHIEIMDVKDINHYREFKTKRITNPLDPVYTVQTQEGIIGEIGRVMGSQSRQLHPANVNKPLSQTLQTGDIIGAQAGTHTDHFLRRNGRKDFREVNQAKDIEGAQVGTLRKGMHSVRKTNPLQPDYQLPGAKEIYGGKTFLQSANQMINHGSNLQTKLTNAQKLDSFLSK